MLTLSGAWTIEGLGHISHQLANLVLSNRLPLTIDGTNIAALDATGAWILQKVFQQPGQPNHPVQVGHLKTNFFDQIQRAQLQIAVAPPDVGAVPVKCVPLMERMGLATIRLYQNGAALLAFVGENSVKFFGWIIHPDRIRVRSVLFNLRSAGVDALPIVGLLIFMLGLVVAYQSADQLRRFGANIFIVDLVGLSMLREFAPLITAIIVAGRSGSAYAAQIGTMKVTEEIDALQTVGVNPYEMLVLPKVIALMIALPLLTVFADILGVFGGMVMARAELGVGFGEFLARFVKAIDMSAYLVGVGKAFVFAAIISTVGCFQGFRASGGPDSIGRRTTRSVVDSIFLVILVDALFSIAFSTLDL